MIFSLSAPRYEAEAESPCVEPDMNCPFCECSDLCKVEIQLIDRFSPDRVVQASAPLSMVDCEEYMIDAK